MTAAREYACIEAFAGAGGLGRGLHEAGFTIRTAFDADPWAVETYRKNLSSDCIIDRAEQLSGRRLLSLAGVKRGELDLFAGGPPCQGFSKQKRGAHKGDERNFLVLEFARLVAEILPRFFLLENVAIFGQKRGKALLAKIMSSLSPHGYEFAPHFYNCADYGLAQTRERFILVGQRRGYGTPFVIPEPTHKKWLTVGEVIGDLPEPPEDYTDHPDYPNHQRARVTELNIRRFSHVPQGGGWADIPRHLRLKCHREVDTSSGGWPDVYGRLEWDGRCPTITGGFDSFTRGRYGHPLYDRPLTPREAARLQGLPDHYVFCGNRADVRAQIGNAVPPPLARAVGKSLVRSLRGD